MMERRGEARGPRRMRRRNTTLLDAIVIGRLVVFSEQDEPQARPTKTFPGQITIRCKIVLQSLMATIKICEL